MCGYITCVSHASCTLSKRTRSATNSTATGFFCAEQSKTRKIFGIVLGEPTAEIRFAKKNKKSDPVAVRWCAASHQPRWHMWPLLQVMREADATTQPSASNSRKERQSADDHPTDQRRRDIFLMQQLLPHRSMCFCYHAVFCLMANCNGYWESALTTRHPCVRARVNVRVCTTARRRVAHTTRDTAHCAHKRHGMYAAATIPVVVCHACCVPTKRWHRRDAHDREPLAKRDRTYRARVIRAMPRTKHP